MKKIRQFMIVSLIAICAIFASSCALSYEVKTEKIDLSVGEFVDIADHVDFDFDMSLSNTDSVSILGETVLHAERPGTTIVRVTHGAYSHDITVNVEYAEPQLNISCSSPLFTTVKGTILEFTADLGVYSSPDTQIIWYLGDRANPVEVGKTYSLALNNYGTYEVTAKAAGQSQTLVAVCYEPFEKAPSISCDRSNNVPVGSTVDFVAEFQNNIAPQIEWRVNGEVMQLSDSSDFSFSPEKVGSYNIFALVNGIKTNEITFIVSGKTEIKNVFFDFDSSFPELYLKWDGVVQADYEVTVDGSVYNSNSDRFNDNSFDLTGIVDLSKSSSVSLRCVGGEYYSSSDSVEVTTPSLTAEEISFLSDKYCDGNYYMTSDREVYDFIEYAVIFRPQAEKVENNEKTSFTLYMGYDSEFSAAMLLSKGWAYTEQTGSYRLKAEGNTKKGGKPRFEITFITGDEPTNFVTGGKPRYDALTSPTFGSGTEHLPIEDAEEGGEAETSDELYYVVQKGYRPLPVPGSAAERVYEKAKEILCTILSDDMDTERKIRAIFDWVMLNTVYDYSVVTDDVITAVRQPAFYLEGVFDTGYAVCDGIAKSISLMCNMAGIPCVRVVGYVNNGTVGRHAWNKVYLDGEWYILDATWCDSTVAFGNKTYESGVHGYYLKADCEMPTHIEMYPSLYPRANSFYDWYGRRGISVNDSSVDELYEAIVRATENIVFEVRIGEEVNYKDYYCIEIRLSQKAKKYFVFHGVDVTFTVRLAISDHDSTWTYSNDLLLIMIYK